jgi:anti-sigma regulatory factor (Ser/Thr protein kinase)
VLRELADASTACADGRRFVAQHLSRWQVPAQVSDEATLLTSELIANAIRHAPPPLCLEITVDTAKIRIDVHDSDPMLPMLTRPDFNSSGGRGVWLVDTIASRWGYRPEPPGKVVWFEMDLPTMSDTAATSD